MNAVKIKSSTLKSAIILLQFTCKKELQILLLWIFVSYSVFNGKKFCFQRFLLATLNNSFIFSVEAVEIKISALKIANLRKNWTLKTAPLKNQRCKLQFFRKFTVFTAFIAKTCEKFALKNETFFTAILTLFFCQNSTW